MNLNSAFSNRHSLHAYVISVLVLIISFTVITYSINYFSDYSRQTKQIQESFTENAVLLDEKAEEVKGILLKNPSNFWPYLERSVNPEKFIIQIYLRDELIYWNSQKISNEILFLDQLKKDTVIQQNTGWFLLHFLPEDDYNIFLFKQIKTQYEYDNSYLPNEFNREFGSSAIIQLTSDFSVAQFTIKDIEGNDCLGLIYDTNNSLSNSMLILLFTLFVLMYVAIVLIFNRLYDIIEKSLKHKSLTFLFYCFDLFALRFLDFYFEIPGILKHSFLFVPEGLEIAGLTTIGDLFLNSIVILAIGIKLFSVTNRKKSILPIKNIFGKVGIVILTGFISFLLNYVIYITVNLLDYHLLLGIQFNDLKGYIALLIVLILSAALFVFTVSFQRILIKSSVSIYLVFFIVLITGGIAFILIEQWQFLILVSSLVVVLTILITSYPTKKQDVRFIKFICLAILFSISSAFVINKAEYNNRDLHQEKMMQILSKPDDTDLEKRYRESYSKILKDKYVEEIVNNFDEPELALETYLKETYFSDFSKKYDIYLTLCEENELLEIEPEGIILSCDKYFDNLVIDSVKLPGDSSLYIIERRPDRIAYLGKITLNDTSLGNEKMKIYIQFLFAYVPEGLGYPELLIDNKNVEIDLSGYSYAVYKNDQLDYKFGGFAYYTSFSFLSRFADNEFFDLMNYRHYKMELEPGQFIVLSRPVAKVSEQLVAFSGLFLCFVIITFLVLVIAFGMKTRQQLGLSFRNRLQILFVSTISVVIALMAVITLFYVDSNNENRIFEQLNEKTYSVIIELDHKLSGAPSLVDLDQDYLHEMLRKFSLVFFSDINLYDANGQIIASSRPEIFKKGLLSENINPMAYEELIVKNKLHYITRETIGIASYYSSYAPFYLNPDRPAGIVNLPYFARQTEVRQAYYLMFFTFINLFVIFGIIGAFIALFLSRIMAKPLFLLQQSIGNLRIDKENEKIEWNRDDEIGQLIGEYNRMVDKLEQSAELLKHSERESAWREVAQQIAHEIKNPLTPMKLNVQYLEKAYNAKDSSFDSKIKNISASLITQIDSLAKVAEMFSDFAKSNAGNFEKVDLVKVVHSSVLLFTNHSKVKFKVEVQNTGDNYFTPAIEKDLLRVFNNLLKNAIQAIESKSDGFIKVRISKTSNYNLVQVIDNGKGILVDVRANIFQPYFTTKSGGTGLGLAIVKNIISEIGGEIVFEPGENKGTVFNLKFKIF